MTAGQILVASLACGSIACFLVPTVAANWPWRRRDEHRGATEAYADELHRHRLILSGEVPIVPGLIHIAPSPLARHTSHRCDDTATTPLGYQPRHLSVGPRDPDMDALLTTTAVFDAIAESEGAPVREHGPREDELVARRIEWNSREWAQPTLEIPEMVRR